MSTLKEDVKGLCDRVNGLDNRLQRVERRLEVLLWLLGTATGILVAVGAELIKTALHI